MTSSVPALPAIPDRDGEHLRLLAVFHFILAGLMVLGGGFLLLHYWIMRTAFSSASFSTPQVPPPGWPAGEATVPPQNPAVPGEILEIMVFFYLFIGLLLLLGIILNALSGAFLLKRGNRMFSLIVAGLNCLQVPFGTALGIFTIIVLCRDSVRAKYEAAG